jgi:hypothetical protein
MKALLEVRRARRSLLVSLALAAAAVLVFRSRNVVHAPGPTAITLAFAAVAALGEALVRRENSGAIVRTIAAATRAASALIVCTQWASEAREVWGAIAVATVWNDARDGASRDRPLIPLGLGLSWAIAWSALRPSDAVPRVAAVAAIAAFGVQRFASGLNDEAARAHE